MEIMEIIKESFVFPSKDIGKLAIFIVMSIVLSGFAFGGLFSTVFGLIDSVAYTVIGIILFIIALILGFILSGYQISIIKSGIEFSEAPEFEWKNNLITGIYNLIVYIVYYIIPTIIVLIVCLITNVPGNIYAIFEDAFNSSVNATVATNSTVNALSTVSDVLIGNLITSLAITGIVAIIVFIIFSFIQTMAQARLANTDSLGDALNIPEAFKDIGRIGWGKVIATVILMGIVSAVINFIIMVIAQYVPSIGIITIIVTPYLMFFSCRAIGLLYSDIV